MKKENEDSRATGNKKNSKVILTKSHSSLHRSQADVISFFKQNAGQYISTYDFRKNGISKAGRHN